MTRRAGNIPRYHAGRYRLTSSDFPCRGGASISRIGSVFPRIVWAIASSIAARCRAIFQRPRLAISANRAGVKSETTCAAIFDVDVDIEHLESNLLHKPLWHIDGGPRRMPGLGSVAEPARHSPVDERQAHRPRLAFENRLPQRRF